MQKRDKLVLGIGLFAMVLTIIIGTSYAYWKLSKVQEDRNIIATGCFNIEFTDGDGINLQNAFPISDEEGLKLTPYTFTIKNTCDDWAAYQINLETLEQATGKVLPDEYVRVDLQEGTSRKKNSTLNSSIETETTLTEAVKAYKLYEGMLKAQEEKTYNLRIWMDKDVQAVEDAMNAFYSGKVTIEMSYRTNTMKNAGTLRYINGRSDTTAFWNYRSNIKKIVFQNAMNSIESELTWDVSEANDGSVMSYLLPNEEDNTKYTLYLQGDGGIYANPNSSDLFNGFTNLTTIEGLEYFDTSRVTNMYSMFYNCKNLTNLDLNNFDTSKVTNMSSMFSGCRSLISLNLSNFDTSNVINMSYMFKGGDFYGENMKLVMLEISNFNTSKVTNMSEMFYKCSKLTNLNLSNFDTSNVTTMSSMFYDCSSLTELNVNSFDTSQVTNMSEMFYNCFSLIELNVSSFNTSNVTDMRGMFGATNSGSSGIKIKKLNLNNFNTSNVINMREMFKNCENLTSLDIGSFNTSQVTDMSYMFSNCSNLKNLDLSNFNTSKVTNMSEMFYNCVNLIELNVNSFDTSQVTNMSGMFKMNNIYSKLETINLNNFNTSKVTNMSEMFSNCSKLTNLDLSSFDTSKVTKMGGMLYDCKSLVNLNLNSFNFNSVVSISNYLTSASIYGILENCPKVIVTINMNGNNITEYREAFLNAATEPGAQIIVNYTEETSELVDRMIATKSSDSNVVKGSLIS